MLVKSSVDMQQMQEYLLQLRADPVLAAREIFSTSPTLPNFELVPHQRMTLRGTWSAAWSLWVEGRGVSKTFSLAMYAVLRALLFANEKILIVGPTFRQSQLVFSEVEDKFLPADLVQACLAHDPKHSANEYVVKFTNGSTIIAVPLGVDGSKIRGYRATCILADEAAQIPEEIIGSVILPFLSTSKNPTESYRGGNVEPEEVTSGMIFASSAYYKFNHLYAKYLFWLTKIRENDPEFSLYHWNYFDIQPYAPDFIKPRVIQFAKMTTPEDIFRMEWLAEFADDSSGYYPASLVNSCKSSLVFPKFKDTKGKRYFLGVDPARVRDNTAFVVIELDGENRNVVYTEAHLKMPYPEQANRIVELTKDFNIEAIGIDDGGGGHSIRDILATHEYPILAVDDVETAGFRGSRIMNMINWNTQVINDMNTSLKSKMEHSVIKFANNVPLIEEATEPNYNFKRAEDVLIEIRKLCEEITNIQVKESRMTMLSFSTPDENSKKDRWSALLMANYVADMCTRQKTVLKPATGFWLDR